jgi:hypothetical protein
LSYPDCRVFRRCATAIDHNGDLDAFLLKAKATIAPMPKASQGLSCTALRHFRVLSGRLERPGHFAFGA